MKINKKFLQLYAAFAILVFHLWLPVTGLLAEDFLVRIGYVGVDIFFFLSAYSLSGRKIEYKSFMLNRFTGIYGKLIILTVVAAIYKKWKLIKVVKVLTCMDLFQNGGGAFLWFLPAIMLFYGLFPLFLKIKFKYKELALLIIWFICAVVITKFTGYREIFIVINRIPVILLGTFANSDFVKKLIENETEDKKTDKKVLPRILTTVIGIAAGLALLYRFGYRAKLNEPAYDFYYIVAIIFVIGVVTLSTFIPEWKRFNVVSRSTLEIYGIQMIFGANLVMELYGKIENKLIINGISLVIIIAGAVAFRYLYEQIQGGIGLLIEKASQKPKAKLKEVK